MKNALDILLSARASDNTPDIDAWLLPVILELLAPVERACLECLMVESIDTPELAATIGHTLEQTGAALSRLRRRGLVITTHETTDYGRIAIHEVADWIGEVDEHR